jgi:hypothetical protein
MKISTEKIICAAAVIGACAMIVLTTHHSVAESPGSAPGVTISTVAPAAAGVQLTPTPASTSASTSPSAPQPAALDPAAAGRLLGQLQTMRSTFELWKLQHEDRFPDLKRYDKWQQFTQRTSVRGELKDGKGTFGPYFTEAPRNALNNLSAVAISGDDVKPELLAFDHPVGFVLSMPSGRIYGADASGRKIIADATLDRVYQAQLAKLTPKVSDPFQSDTREARLASLMEQINTMQAQLLLYKLQHRDALPDLVKLADWQQLTQRTDGAGKIVERGEFGPYLAGIPRNPLTGDYRVALTTAGRKSPQQLRDARVGYVLDPKTAQLWAVDENGKCITVKRAEVGS